MSIPKQNRIDIHIVQIKDTHVYYCDDKKSLTPTETLIITRLLDAINKDVSLIVKDISGNAFSVKELVSYPIEEKDNDKLDRILDTASTVGSFAVYVYPIDIIQSYDIQRVNGYYARKAKKDGETLIKENQKRKYDFFHQELFSNWRIKSVPLVHIFNTSAEQFNLNNARYFNITDSSIWNHLVFLDDDNEAQFDDDIRETVELIKKAHCSHYYSLGIAQEYASLNARLAQQAYIEGDHGDKMSPFLFHSESKMRHLIYDDKEDKEDNEATRKAIRLKLDAIRKHKWRFLLLDDKHTKLLSPNTANVNKSMILKSRLDSVVGQENVDYILEYAATVKEAEEKIGKTGKDGKRYDVIFVDYLLEDNHYGYELLKGIKNQCDIYEGTPQLYQEFPYVGPFGRLFFMFTSAFTTAVSERLVLEGMNRSKDYWYIGEGACPTNTPALFDYYLITILYKRIQDAGIVDLSCDSVYNLMYEIFRPKKDEPGDVSVRKRANDNYQKVLSLQYHYHRLLKDVDHKRGSELATSFVKNHTHIGGFLEHLVQLVHITAFGSVRQWPEMWEEFLFCKAQFDDYYLTEDDNSNGNSAILDSKKNKLASLYNNIEKHIFGIKSLNK